MRMSLPLQVYVAPNLELPEAMDDGDGNPTSLDTLFRFCLRECCPDSAGLDQDEAIDLLLRREAAGPTVYLPGMAIPHAKCMTSLESKIVMCACSFASPFEWPVALPWPKGDPSAGAVKWLWVLLYPDLDSAISDHIKLYTQVVWISLEVFRQKPDLREDTAPVCSLSGAEKGKLLGDVDAKQFSRDVYDASGKEFYAGIREWFGRAPDCCVQLADGIDEALLLQSE